MNHAGQFSIKSMSTLNKQVAMITFGADRDLDIIKTVSLISWPKIC